MVMISTLELKRTTLLGQAEGLKCPLLLVTVRSAIFRAEALRNWVKMEQSPNLGKPYSECETSSRHQFCDLMGPGKKINYLIIQDPWTFLS